MSALQNTLELERILNSDTRSPDEVHRLIDAGIDPFYKQGELVARIATTYNNSTLKWYTKKSSAEFMASRYRAWNIVKAVWDNYRASQGKSAEGIERIYTKDARPDKRNSIAYLRVIRESLMEDDDFSVTLLKMMGWDFPPVLIQALGIDFTSSEDLPNRGGYDSLSNSAYVLSVSQLSALGDFEDTVKAFAGSQVMLAESKDDKPFLIANLLLGGWNYLIDYDKYVEEVLWATRAFLASPNRKWVSGISNPSSTMFVEFASNFREPSNLFKGIALLEEVSREKGFELKYEDDGSFRVAVNRKGDRMPALRGIQMIPEADLAEKKTLAAIYLRWREKGLMTAADRDGMIAEMRALPDEDGNVETFVEAMELLHAGYEN